MRRLVINRAYYGAFHVARTALRAAGMTPDETRFHRQVWAAFAVPHPVVADSAEDALAISDLGTWLQLERTRADYDGSAEWTARDCRAAVRRAHVLVARVDALSPTPSSASRDG